ncbi:MAG TPA: chemotaxis protein CheA [Thermoanaerobaculia bacterium]|jgi:two-component system chemotaxis sensor kinase CheA|nr:chemotaxis protein CheA [Thermoanaerobaculia bacterium]
MEFDAEALLLTFIAETEENLRTIEEGLLSLERNPEDAEVLQTVFRMAHTLKGNSASLGFTGVAEFAHVLEDQLEKLRQRTAPVTAALVTVLLESVDSLREMLPVAVEGNHEIPAKHQQVLRRLAAGTAEPARLAEPAAAPAVPEAEASGRAGDSGRTLRVAIDKLDRLMTLAGEIAISRGRLRQILEDNPAPGALEAHQDAAQLYAELQELVMQARMVPVGPTLRQYVRSVRDLATAQGKLARVTIQGEDVEVDTTIIEHLRDPLTHMIRNALHHGIETPESRRRKGKDPCGAIALSAWREAASIVIELSDDGAGFNRTRIVEEARRRGLSDAPEALPDADLYRLVFEPGFSTAESVTEWSGRGMGMDVVRDRIAALRGSIAIESWPDAGTAIKIRLPLTLAIIEGFGVGIGSETYVIPVDRVVECMELPNRDGRRERHGILQLRGEALPFVRLRDLFGAGGPDPERESVVVVRHDLSRTGIVVDRLYGQSQAVIKPLGELFQGVRGLCGSTILGDGRVAFILDVPGLLENLLSQNTAATAA